jgi:LacI family transcriptional regulator
MPNMVNVKQVALLAGVSSATVSRALSAPELLRPETLKRVQEAIASLDYVPFAAARILRSGRTMSIGIIAPTLMNELYARAVDTLEKQLEALGYTVVLTCHRDNSEIELRCARELLERRVDGIAIIGSQHHPEVFSLIHKHNVPYVLMWATDREGSHPTVGYDNRLAMRRLTAYLVGLGHREFAVLPGPLNTQHLSVQRLEGVKDVLSEHGIALREELVLPTPYEVEPARAAARACLTSPHRPTALICINDFIAVAAIAECRALGRSIPADISVTGFGDWQVAELITPTLTTMRSNPVRIGELTARNIIAQIEGTARREDLQDEFEPELIVRESAAAVKIVAAP